MDPKGQRMCVPSGEQGEEDLEQERPSGENESKERQPVGADDAIIFFCHVLVPILRFSVLSFVIRYILLEPEIINRRLTL